MAAAGVDAARFSALGPGGSRPKLRTALRSARHTMPAIPLTHAARPLAPGQAGAAAAAR